MALLLFSFIVAGVAALFAVLFSPDWAGLLLAVVALIIVPVTEEFRLILKEVDLRLAQRPFLSWLAPPLKRLARPLRRAAPAFAYIDLSLMLGATIVLCLFLANSFTASVEDLVAKGFISFAQDKDGFVHLQTYLRGYLFMPPILLTCATYGFYRGVRDNRVSLAKLVLAVLLGTFAPVLLLSMIRGEFTGFEGYEKMAHANPGSLPAGTSLIVPMVIASLALLTWLFLAIFIWLFSLLGRTVGRFLSNRASKATTEDGV